MAENDYVRGNMDIEAQKATYTGVMNFSARWGVPGAMGLATFFTSLLLNFGILGSIFLGVLVLFAVHIIVKLFFSH